MASQKDDFAPRLGLAWQLHPKLVIGGGAGIFYDLGYSAWRMVTGAFPYRSQRLILNTSFPLSHRRCRAASLHNDLPRVHPRRCDPNHVLPRTYEWNAALEKRFGKSDVLYGHLPWRGGPKTDAAGQLQQAECQLHSEIRLIRNGANSSYQALQAQYRHRLAYGLQALLSYTWSHSIDDVSSDANLANVPPGASGFRIVVRPTMTPGKRSLAQFPTTSCARHRSLEVDIRKLVDGFDVYARTAPPVNVATGQNLRPLFSQQPPAFSARTAFPACRSGSPTPT